MTNIFTAPPVTWTNDLPVSNSNTFNLEIRDKFNNIITNVVDKTTAQTLTNKTLTSPVINSPVINTPTGDVATLTGIQTLTNKTLTSPIINGATGDATIRKGVVPAVQVSAGDILSGPVFFGVTFAAPPIVIACLYNPSYATTYSGVSVTPTTTEFTFWVNNYGAVDGFVGISWIAIGTV